MDAHKIDGHKLDFHPERVADWASGKLVYPIYVEIAPVGADLDFEKTRPRIFHLGYLLLLDALDERDAKFGTRAARLLAAAQAAGIKTSVDVVSEDSDRFAGIVAPALQHVDYCIVNEIEAGKTTGFRVRQPNGKRRDAVGHW